MIKKVLVTYWRTSASEDWNTAEVLLRSHIYHYALFFCQLSLEKLLKGLTYKRTGEHPLPIHNLIKLADIAKLNYSDKQKELLKEITTWNIQARYDSYKREFYKKATQEFTVLWFTKVKELYLWLNDQF